MRWAGHAPCVGDRRGAYRFWLGYLMETDHLEGLSVMWEYNIKMNVMGRCGLDSDRWRELVNAVMNLWVP